MKKKLAALLLLIISNLLVFSQETRISYFLEAQAIATTPDHVPFWMRSNQYGSFPLSGLSSSLIGRAERQYDTRTDSIGKLKKLDWAMAVEGRVNAGSSSQFIVTEGYLKGRLGPFELKAGRNKETMGLTGDTALTSGSFAISGNALGIPKIGISIPNFYSLPFFDRLFAIKGTFSNGWVGTTDLRTVNTKVPKVNSYYHEKSFYARFGKPQWRLKLYGGFNHEVYWGNERQIFGSDFQLPSAQTFLYVVSGKKYSNRTVASSKVGNHLGSIDLGLEYRFYDFKLFLYRQNFYDVGALYYLANLKDGLNGITIINNNSSPSCRIHWNAILFELLYTKNQAGEPSSPFTPSGDEDYYNNWIYEKGWSYFGVGLGTPFISTKTSTKAGLPSYPSDFFINNRVVSFHTGISARIFSWNYIFKGSLSNNYGTFGTSPYGHTTGKKRSIPTHGFFKKTRQISAYLEGVKPIAKRMSLGFAAAIDRGGLYDNSAALLLKISKSF